MVLEPIVRAMEEVARAVGFDAFRRPAAPGHQAAQRTWHVLLTAR
jgi:hypothetical protein